ncbi:GNAT family N-acetyltransferase [Vibrio porteresiae]|uniref:GNAT family N-acetyltransferase n=1 Tax=Vibrio porteresiae DSM 19223 TaxID=1123496 RepID=A0ABZ0QJ81_9VIBR|nr:GNAT family N-acetyltransferase [Vibrio porteresiae]WPC75498.1 GNAT family N-acetyltransferase [Vibrio porteresiae DSM 19223]
MLFITNVSYSEEYAPQIRAIRDEVFIQEQGIDPTLEFDGCDADALHALITIDGQPVATGRLLNDGHIGRIAVLAAYRGQGVGAQVVRSLIKEAELQGYARVYLGAQVHAVDFYRKLGFVSFGDEFVEAGIPHLAMEKNLK